MPVYKIACPDCGRVSKSFILRGARMPTEWTCSGCGGRRARPDPNKRPEPHPWETGHGAGCPCCGG